MICHVTHCCTIRLKCQLFYHIVLEKSIHAEFILNLKFNFLVPSQPLNLTVGAVTDTTMELSWLKPKSSDAEKTLDYYIYYHRNNNTECKKYSASSYDVNFSLTDLGMYTV